MSNRFFAKSRDFCRNDSEEELAIFESILSQRPNIAEMLAYKARDWSAEPLNWGLGDIGFLKMGDPLFNHTTSVMNRKETHLENPAVPAVPAVPLVSTGVYGFQYGLSTRDFGPFAAGERRATFGAGYSELWSLGKLNNACFFFRKLAGKHPFLNVFCF